MIKSSVFKSRITVYLDKPDGLTETEEEVINDALNIANKVIENRIKLNIEEQKK